MARRARLGAVSRCRVLMETVLSVLTRTMGDVVTGHGLSRPALLRALAGNLSRRRHHSHTA